MTVLLAPGLRGKMGRNGFLRSCSALTRGGVGGSKENDTENAWISTAYQKKKTEKEKTRVNPNDTRKKRKKPCTEEKGSSRCGTTSRRPVAGSEGKGPGKRGIAGDGHHPLLFVLEKKKNRDKGESPFPTPVPSPEKKKMVSQKNAGKRKQGPGLPRALQRRPLKKKNRDGGPRGPERKKEKKKR